MSVVARIRAAMRDRIDNSPRKVARRAGHKKYVGPPCPHGHDGVRYVSSAACVDCIYMHVARRKLRGAN